MPDIVIPAVEEFETYLEGFAPDTPIGYPIDGARCPLAEWLRTLYPTAVICVGDDEIEIDDFILETPAWVEEIVCAVDAKWDFDDEVAAGWCLEKVRTLKEATHAGV